MNRAVLLLMFLLIAAEAKRTEDPYKVLGVDKNASQRDIQKAFHKLSLQYHPDKNKAKGAQEKFSEINNAYEILSDEEKRKNYDLYGDEKGAGFDGGNFGNYEGYSHFSGGGSGNNFFRSNPGGWQNMGGQGKSFSFSFGGNPGAGGSPFGFNFGDMFSNFFGSGMNRGAGSHGFGRAQPSSSGILEDVNMQFFNKQIKDQGLTWILLFYNPSAMGLHAFESIVEDIATSLNGAVKAGRVNCQIEQNLCMDLGVSVLKRARLFIYSYSSNDGGSLVEYNGEHDSRSLKSFCQQQLPKFSRRIELGSFDFSFGSTSSLPQLLLLSTKKDTPAIWRVISGLYRKQFIFYDTEVHDVSHPILKRLGIHELPAVVGKTTTGEERVLKQGILVKDLSSGISDLRTLLRSFENKNKKASSEQARRASKPEEGHVPILMASNMDSICSEKTAVCIIGAFRSLKSKEKLETILSEVSQKSLVRWQSRAQDNVNSITYCLLDASKQSAFMYAFDRLGYKSLDKFLVAYKPKRGRFAAFTDEITLEATERFVSSVLNGDIKFSKIRKQPIIK